MIRPPILPQGQNPAAKAEALLRDHLGERVYALFQQTGRLMRPSRLWPGVEYYVQRNDQVRVIRDGQQVASLCVVPQRGEPEADRLLTILDMIQTDERRLWEMGNLTAIASGPETMRPPPPPPESNFDRWAERHPLIMFTLFLLYVTGIITGLSAMFSR